ncbi:MAG: histidine phosphatase family protein [Ahrensia sp.]|nr:histidine phosphatase family protein [Ahrensia sp.]
MTLQLCLIAHGATLATQNAAFPNDDALLDGADKALEPPAVLRRWINSQVRTSPMLAARQTAAMFGLDATDDHSIADMNYGRWSGHTIASIAAAEPSAVAEWMHDPSFIGHGGESRAALSLRVSDWLQSLSHGHGRFIAVTHVSIIRTVILDVLQSPVSSGAFWSLDVAPATMTELSHDGRRWTIRKFGVKLL